MSRVPVAARILVQRLAPPDRREAVVGDLDEEFEERAAEDGVPEARRWYWSQVLRSSGPLLALRVRRRGKAGRIDHGRGMATA